MSRPTRVSSPTTRSSEFKALLLNLFVCPGSGHLYLNKKRLGWAILIVTAISLSLMLADILSVSRQMADELLAGSLPMDITGLMAEIHTRTLSMESAQQGLYLLAAAWLFGIADSLRLLWISRAGSR